MNIFDLHKHLIRHVVLEVRKCFCKWTMSLLKLKALDGWSGVKKQTTVISMLCINLFILVWCRQPTLINSGTTTCILGQIMFKLWHSHWKIHPGKIQKMILEIYMQIFVFHYGFSDLVPNRTMKILKILTIPYTNGPLGKPVSSMLKVNIIKMIGNLCYCPSI